MTPRFPRGDYEGIFTARSGEVLLWEYDPFLDVVTLGGTRYAAEFFRLLGNGPGGLVVDSVFTIRNREDGSVTIQPLLDVEGKK